MSPGDSFRAVAIVGRSDELTLGCFVTDAVASAAAAWYAKATANRRLPSRFERTAANVDGVRGGRAKKVLGRRGEQLNP